MKSHVYSYQQVLVVDIEEQRIIFSTSTFEPNARAAHTRIHAQLLTHARDRVRCAQADYVCPMQTECATARRARTARTDRATAAATGPNRERTNE